jgi:hypothetical protein
MQRDVAAAAHQEGAEDGDPEGTAGLARGVEDTGRQPDAMARRVAHRHRGHRGHGQSRDTDRQA